tara:strand:- start:584 stop:1189 length:606 start_codon:yes stop_codon:yes gene_type:complete
MDRDTRRLSNEKQGRIKATNAIPTNHEGNDGDMVMVNGTLYIKNNNVWHSYSSDEDKKSNTPAFMATMDGDMTSITSGYSTIQFDTIQFDTFDFFNSTSYRYVIPPKESGLYYISATILLDNDSGAGSSSIRLSHVNDAESLSNQWIGWGTASAGGAFYSCHVQGLFLCNPGDYFYTEVGGGADADLQYANNAVFLGFKVN